MADETPQAPWPRPTVLEQSTEAAGEVADRLAEQTDRAKEVAAEQTAGLRRDPASAAIVAQLVRQTELLGQIAEAGERKEAPAPGQFRTPFVLHVRIRATKWILTVATAGKYTLRNGANLIASVITNGPETKDIDIPVTIERGTDVAVTAENITASGETESRSTTVVDAAALDALGTKATYTVPAGLTARLVGVSLTASAAPGTLELRLTRGATVITLGVFTAAALQELDIPLLAADVVTWQQTVAAGAGVTGDLTISVNKYTPNAAATAEVVDSVINGYPE